MFCGSKIIIGNFSIHLRDVGQNARLYRGLALNTCMSRVWCMPNGDTLQIPEVRAFVNRWFQPNGISVDPFARNCNLCSITNDLNPETSAKYHMDVKDFLLTLNAQKVAADFVIWDPPYSLEQCKRSYENVGRKVTMRDTQIWGRWSEEKNLLNNTLKVGGIILSFGWNSIGMGINRFYEQLEILLVCHGGAHNDTICVAERKTAHQESLFSANELTGNAGTSPNKIKVDMQ